MAADNEATYTGNEMPYMTDKEATYTGKKMHYMTDKEASFTGKGMPSMRVDKEATYTAKTMLNTEADNETTYTGKEMPYKPEKDNAPSVERQLFNEEEEEESQLHWEGDALYDNRQRGHIH